ncbi:unnamed protein product [Periconia digitata]|uniref:Uncharacterized protein n=1 Tax=Periconia digitata TaxID=1303443 RepID=A0A9W4UG26_9PLEO|nr:unnamed protein product [Periconia digitata]
MTNTSDQSKSSTCLSPPSPFTTTSTPGFNLPEKRRPFLHCHTQIPRIHTYVHYTSTLACPEYNLTYICAYFLPLLYIVHMYTSNNLKTSQSARGSSSALGLPPSPIAKILQI